MDKFSSSTMPESWFRKTFGMRGTPSAPVRQREASGFTRPHTVADLTALQIDARHRAANGEILSRMGAAEARRLVAWGFLVVSRRGSSRRATRFALP